MLIRLSSIFICLAIVSSINAQDNASYAVDNISKELSAKANAVFRKDVTSVVLHSDKKYTAAHEQVITIMNKKGDGYANFAEFYKEGSTQIKSPYIKIYDKDGKLLRKVKSKDVEDFAAHDGMSLISDGRMKVFSYQPTSYPVTVAMSWIEESSNTLSLPTWWPIRGANVSVEKSSYHFTNKTSIKIRAGERNLEDYNIDKLNDYSYQLENQPVVHGESYVPSLYDRVPMVFVAPVSFNYEGYEGSYQSWEEFGGWIHNELLDDKADLKKHAAKSELGPILEGITDKREIIKKIYDFVQENTRYILIGLDEGGLVPLSAQKVHEVKYGDCKALSFYMKSLLDVYGIESNYVIVRAGSDKPEDIFKEYPHVSPANHVILNAPLENDTIWLDCTSHDNPFNFLGSFTDDRLALQVNESGGTLVRTPAYGKESNATIIKADVTLTADGDIATDLDIEAYGLKIDKVIYLKKLKSKEFDEYVNQYLLAKFDNLELSNHEFSLDEEEVMTTEQYSFSATKYGERAGDYMILESAFMPFDIPRLKKDSNRENLISFPRAEQLISDVVYNVPVGFHCALPEPIVIDGEFGSYVQKVEQVDAGIFKVHRSFVLNKGEYDADRYKEVKFFFDKIRKAERGKLSLSAKS